MLTCCLLPSAPCLQGDILAERPNHCWFQLSGCMLIFKPEKFSINWVFSPLFCLSSLDTENSDFCNFHQIFFSLIKTWVEIDNLCAAKRNASLATSLVTTFHFRKELNRVNPRLPILRKSTFPYPCGFRQATSHGFMRNTLIQILPPRLTWRVIAIRAASICLAVIQRIPPPAIPYSPKAIRTSSCLLCLPFGPFCNFLYFTLFALT